MLIFQFVFCAKLDTIYYPLFYVCKFISHINTISVQFITTIVMKIITCNLSIYYDHKIIYNVIYLKSLCINLIKIILAIILTTHWKTIKIQKVCFKLIYDVNYIIIIFHYNLNQLLWNSTYISSSDTRKPMRHVHP